MKTFEEQQKELEKKLIVTTEKLLNELEVDLGPDFLPLLKKIEQARENAIKKLVRDGHSSDEYCVKDIHCIARNIATLLILICSEEIYKKEEFLSLCLLGFEPLYGKMFQKGLLPENINTFEEFSARYVHFLHELDSGLKKPLNVLEDGVEKIREAFCNFDTKNGGYEKGSDLNLESLRELPIHLKEKYKKYTKLPKREK